MASWGESCQQAGGESLERLARFRRELYWCLWRCPDALFELADAVLTAPGPVASLPYLSLEPAFRRGHGMVYRSLGEGGVDEEALRDLLVAARPRDWPLVFAIDASTYPRPEAECSPGREFHHHSCAGFHSSDGAAIAGWAFQWLAQLSFVHDSWTAPQDQVRVGARDDATRQAAAQVIKLSFGHGHVSDRRWNSSSTRYEGSCPSGRPAGAPAASSCSACLSSSVCSVSVTDRAWAQWFRR